MYMTIQDVIKRFRTNKTTYSSMKNSYVLRDNTYYLPSQLFKNDFI